MSCNGCRVLRKGCSEGCALRPCLQWIDSPESQGFATLFVAKFFGRAGLMEFISAVPENERTALFQSLLYEACGRTVNPVYGAVGLLWSGKWHVCQEAVETVLNGGTLHSATLNNSGSNMGPNHILPNVANMKAQANPPLIASQSSQANAPSMITSPIQSDQLLTVAKAPSNPSSRFQSSDESKNPFINSYKRLKLHSHEDHAGSKSVNNKSLFNSFGPQLARPNQACNNYVASARHNYSIVTVGSTTNPSSSNLIMRNGESLYRPTVWPRLVVDDNDNRIASEKVELDLMLNSTDQQTRRSVMNNEGGLLITRVSSPSSLSEGSIVTTMESPLPGSSCHHLPLSPSSRGFNNIKLLNLLV